MKRFILTLILLTAAYSSVSADGALIVRPEPWMPPRPAVGVKYHLVDVTINDPIAITKVDQVFVNPFDREIEADYIFPIPENALIRRFIAYLGGVKMEAELLDAVQARRIYEEIVSRRKDPALLEYAGRGMYRLRVYPIPARGEVRMKIEYEQTIKSENGTVEYLYPLNTEKYSGTPLDECTVNINITSFENIGSVYCPTHFIRTERSGDKAMKAVYSERNVRPDKDLVLYFTRQKSDFGFHVISHREPGAQYGHFVGIFSPPLKESFRASEKNVIYVLDSSGSMRGEKFVQAISALKFGLEGLSGNDYFNIIDYDDLVRPFRETALQATSANLKDAMDFTNQISSTGGTNIYGALDLACGMIPRNGNPTYIVFLTDGLPTVGNTNIETIISNTTSLNGGRARLFVFGVGYDVNVHLLDRLANENRGVPEYVKPDEDVEAKVSRLTSMIEYPALTDITLAFGNVRADLIYPNPIPDLFYGSEIIIAGRFYGKGNTNAVVRGKMDGKSTRYEFPVTFSSGSSSDEFIDLIWANRRIAYLLQEIRLHGNSSELVEEIINLSKKYGIVTEYTSFLVTGDERHRGGDIAFDATSRELEKKLESSIDKHVAQRSGRSAVNQSQALKDLQYLAVAPPAAEIDIDGQKQSFGNLTQVGSQGFFKAGDNWIQGNLTGNSFDIEIKKYSRAYFQILEKNPSLGKYLGLGEKVRIQIGTQVVQISDIGKETLTSAELKQLFPN